MVTAQGESQNFCHYNVIGNGCYW